MSTRLCVKGLPKHAKEERLREFFGRKGTVTDVRIMRTPEGKSRQFGFVGFASAEEAAEAQRYFQGSFFDTAKLFVEAARPVGNAADTKDERPWSRHSMGSSAHRRAHPEMYGPAAKPKPERTPKSLVESKLTGLGGDAKLEEFLNISKKKTAQKAWMADPTAVVEADAPTKRNAVKARKVKKKKDGTTVIKEAVVSGKVGNRGDIVERTHIHFADSSNDSDSEDYDNIPNVKSENQSENESENDGESESVDLSADSPPSSEIASRESSESNESSESSESNHEKTSLNESIDEKTSLVEPSRNSRLFIRNLSYNTDEESLLKEFSKYGAVAEVHVPIDMRTKRSKGIAFVKYVRPENAVRAMSKADGKTFQGRLIHVMPAKPQNDGTATTSGEAGAASFKESRDMAMKANAGSSHNWNPLIMRTDAVVEAMAHFHGLAKQDILDPEASNLATRVAVAETRIIEETKEFFAEHGVHFDRALDLPPRAPRSGTAILVKNIPFRTSEAELTARFSAFGALRRVLLPLTRTLALVEFEHPTEARAAFRRLAYSRMDEVPIYLEWTPSAAMDDKPVSKPVGASLIFEDRTPTAPDALLATEEDEAALSSNRTLYVKNLNFATSEDALRSAFEPCGAVLSAVIARKSDSRGCSVSLGYGFVEFARQQDALKAIKTLQGTVIDDHALLLAFSRPDASATSASASKRRRRDPVLAPSAANATSRVMVRNVAFEATRKDIRDLFSTFGELRSVRLPKKPDGSHRGFAFVDFASPEVARTAVKQLQNTHLYGRHLVVEFSNPDSLGEPTESVPKKRKHK